MFFNRYRLGCTYTYTQSFPLTDQEERKEIEYALSIHLREIFGNSVRHIDLAPYVCFEDSLCPPEYRCIENTCIHVSGFMVNSGPQVNVIQYMCSEDKVCPTKYNCIDSTCIQERQETLAFVPFVVIVFILLLTAMPPRCDIFLHDIGIETDELFIPEIWRPDVEGEEWPQVVELSGSNDSSQVSLGNLADEPSFDWGRVGDDFIA